MEEYIYFSREDGEKMMAPYEEMIGTFYKDINGKAYEISEILLMPAPPDKRDALWNAILTCLHDEGATRQSVESLTRSYVEDAYAVAQISKEYSTSLRPNFRIDYLQYVVDADSGELALGFGILVSS